MVEGGDEACFVGTDAAGEPLTVPLLAQPDIGVGEAVGDEASTNRAIGFIVLASGDVGKVGRVEGLLLLASDRRPGPSRSDPSV